MNREQLKAIRRGEMSEQEVFDWASDKERHLERLYQESTLPAGPNQELLRDLLLHCLEEHYGNFENCIVLPEAATTALLEIQAILDRFRSGSSRTS